MVDDAAVDVVVELHRADAEPSTTVQENTTHGRVLCRLAVPTPSGIGIVTLWLPVPEHDGPNTRIVRGCPVTAGGYACFEAALGTDGSCEIECPSQRFFVSLTTPEHGRSFQGAIEVRPGADVHVELEAGTGGTIRGSVDPVPDAERGHVWVVAFDAGVICAEARVQADGSFAIGGLPAGRYGVRVGDDDQLHRRWAEWEDPLRLLDHDHGAAPWVGAQVIEVVAGGVAEVVLRR